MMMLAPRRKQKPRFCSRSDSTAPNGTVLRNGKVALKKGLRIGTAKDN